jgi:hypothetical protein
MVTMLTRLPAFSSFMILLILQEYNNMASARTDSSEVTDEKECNLISENYIVIK